MVIILNPMGHQDARHCSKQQKLQLNLKCMNSGGYHGKGRAMVEKMIMKTNESLFYFIVKNQKDCDKIGKTCLLLEY